MVEKVVMLSGEANPEPAPLGSVATFASPVPVLVGLNRLNQSAFEETMRTRGYDYFSIRFGEDHENLRDAAPVLSLF